MADIRTLLLMDDDPAHAESFREALLGADDGPFDGEIVTTFSQGLERLHKKGIWAIFANLSLPDSEGLDTFVKLQQAALSVPTMVLCGADQGDIAAEAMRRGAKDYLLESHIDTYSLARAIRNMAERRAAEEVLFTEKDRASVMLNSIEDAVLSIDISGNVTYLNVVAEQMTGWSRGEAQGKPLNEAFQIIDGATRELSLNPMELAIQTGRTVRLSATCILIRRDQTEISIEVSASPIHDRAGSITGAVIVFHDVGVSRAITEEMVRLEVLMPLPESQELPGADRQLFENWSNHETVENMGLRIRQLRESRRMTQIQLQARSRVSRSYLSRIESAKITPSLGTLEKISEALGIELNRFFVPELNDEALLEDPFIQGLRPFLRQLDWEQWQSILKRLAAISNHVSSGNGHTITGEVRRSPGNDCQRS